MSKIRGKLIAAADNLSLENYAVDFRLTGIFPLENTPNKKDFITVPVHAVARSANDGSFETVIDFAGKLQDPVEILVSAPNGVELSRTQATLQDLSKSLKLKITPVPKFNIQSSTDPSLGKRLRVNGQIIDESGRPVPAGLPVIVWGQKADNAASVPLFVTESQKGGYFSADWPADVLLNAFAQVSGGPELPVPLDSNSRLVQKILLVINLDTFASGLESGESDCSCHDTPMRSPDPSDLTNNPAGFSQDLGGTCFDLTTPNRVLEEFTYNFVVRTSEPNVKGLTLGVQKMVPADMLADLLGVSVAAVALGNKNAGKASLQNSSLQLDVRSAKSLVTGDAPPTIAEFERASWLSQVSQTKAVINAGLESGADRTVLDADHPIDWDYTPTIHLPINLAFGHILQYREVWRADGYSLGDLLYSLPLAPGQRRQIAVVNWDRRTRASREESLEFEEELDALLTRDRDIREVVGTNLQEETSGGSRNTTWGAAGGIGAGIIGSGFGIFGGVAGGGGGSDSSAWQNSARQFAGNSMQGLRDRVAQRSSSVRSQRSTVVEAITQSETQRVETETVANYNHCHAITVEYFEVLRHFLITHELADVRECLFVPLPIEEFTRGKALRWQEPLLRYLKNQKLRPAFTALERIADNWVGWDFPVSRYSEEAPEILTGELRISFLLPRPRDDKDGNFQIDMWRPYSPFLPLAAMEIHTAKINRLVARERDRVFRQEIAPEIAANLVGQLRFAYITNDGGLNEVPLDATLVSSYSESEPLYVSLNPQGGLPNVPRENIAYFKIWYEGPALPPDAKVIVHRGRMRYETPHYTGLLFDNPRILDDISTGDPVLVPTPVSRREMYNPRQKDRDNAGRLLEHLNSHLEFYHQAIWLSMDPQRRYMLLDSVLLSASDPRSIASVCVNEIIGIVGNSLVLPVAPGQRLNPLLSDSIDGRERPDLIHAYAVPPAPAMRVSIPTRGVYAEAISGQCNSCENIDDSRYWRWDTEGQLSLPEIQEVSTDSLQAETPALTPTELPKPLVSIQNAPAIPDPFGLSAAFELMSKPELFRDITGLEGTQRNARAAFDAAMTAASGLGNEAFTLARQNEIAKNSERLMSRIDQAQKDGLLTPAVAQELAESALQGLVGDPQSGTENPTADKAVQKVLDESAQANKANIKVSKNDETVEVGFEDAAPVAGSAALTGTIFDVNLTDNTHLAYVDQSLVLELTPADMIPFVLDPTEDNLKFIWGIGRGTITDEILAKMEQLIDSLKSDKLIQPLASDPNRFKVMRMLRIVYPSESATPNVLAGTGRLPVVLLVHGQHASWKPGTPAKNNHEGYTDLQQFLASKGIVSVSVDTNAANFFGSLIEMRAEMALGALDTLRSLDTDKNSRFFNRLDFNKVAMMGHSRGGDAVCRAARINSSRPIAKKYGIKAVCALAPTDFTGTMSSGGFGPHTLSATDTGFFAVVYGGLDGDVAGNEGAKAFGGTGFRHYDRSTADKAMVFIDHCNHNRFNSVWAADGDDFGNLPSDINTRLLSEGNHKTLAKEYIGGLFCWHLLGDTSFMGAFNGTKGSTVGAGVALQWSFGRKKLVIDDMEDQTKPRLVSNAFIDIFSDISIGTRNLASETNHATNVFYVDPNLAGSSTVLQLNLPAAQRNWSAFDALNLRVCADFDLTDSTLMAAGKLPEFEISLEDGNGQLLSLSGAVLKTSVAPKPPVFHESITSKILISDITAANPARVKLTKKVSLVAGQKVFLITDVDTTPPVTGFHEITPIDDFTVSIPLEVTAVPAGIRGLLMTIENCTALRLDTLSAAFSNFPGINFSDIRALRITVPAGFPQTMFFDSLELIKTF